MWNPTFSSQIFPIFAVILQLANKEHSGILKSLQHLSLSKLSPGGDSDFVNIGMHITVRAQGELVGPVTK